MCLFPQAMQNECSWLFPTLSGCLRSSPTQEWVSASFMDGFGPRSLYWWASLVAQMIKNLPTMQETQVGFLGREDLLEKGMATHSSILAWRIPWTEELGRLQSIGLQRVRHNWVTTTHTQIWASLVLLFLVPWGVKVGCLFKIFLFFLMQAWISINFPLRIIIATSHRSINVVFLFSHLSRYF